MIAKAAGVSKQSLYRRWSSKADIVFQAFIDRVDSFGAVDDGPVEQMLEAVLLRIFGSLQVDGKAITSLIAYAQDDDDFRTRYRDDFVIKRDRYIYQTLARAIELGHLPKDANISLALELVHGAYWYRLLLGKPLDALYAAQIPQSIARALRD
jgi:AcrR family transcriptional regulator